MDSITGMRCFCAVAQQQSFTKAAAVMGISPALCSKYIGQLEDRLGVRLLNRTTRSLSITEQGHLYYAQSLVVIREFDLAETLVLETQTSPKGHIRLSAPRALGESFLVGVIADFLDIYPEISVETKLSDRFVNIVEEGFDLAVRIGALEDSTLIARKLSPMTAILCASPDYLARAGTPQKPIDLIHHQCIIDSNYRGGSHWPFWVSGEKVNVAVKGRATVNSAISCRDLALRGAGIVRSPDQVVANEIKSGRLVVLLSEFVGFEFGVYAVHPHSQYLAAKTRILVDYLVSRFADAPCTKS